MSGMNAEQIHNFKVLMLENTLEPYKYMIMILVVVMVLFLLTRFPTCKVAQTSHHKRPSAMDTLRYLAKIRAFVVVLWLNSFMWVCRSQYGHLPSVWHWSWAISTNVMLQTSWSTALPASLLASL